MIKKTWQQTTRRRTTHTKETTTKYYNIYHEQQIITIIYIGRLVKTKRNDIYTPRSSIYQVPVVYHGLK